MPNDSGVPTASPLTTSSVDQKAPSRLAGYSTANGDRAEGELVSLDATPKGGFCKYFDTVFIFIFASFVPLLSLSLSLSLGSLYSLTLSSCHLTKE